MTREELLNGYKEDVRDFAKECVHFDGELDAAFFDDWAEHFTNLAERLHPPLPEDLEEAASKYEINAQHLADDKTGSVFAVYNYQDGMRDGLCCTEDAFIAGAEWQRKQDQQLIELAEDHAMLAGMNKMKEEMMRGAVEGEVYKFGEVAYVKERNNAELTRYLSQFNNGDKVRVIVIKEEEK